MQCKCLLASLTDLVWNGPAVLRWMVAVLMMTLAPHGAGAGQKCALVTPNFQVAGEVGTFEIAIECGQATANAKDFPAGEVLVGLTLYPDGKANDLMDPDSPTELKRTVDAAQAIATALKTSTSSKSVTFAGGPKWIVLKDEDIESFDFPVQTIKIGSDTGKTVVKFQAELKTFAGKRHMLFAAWSKTERASCDRDDKFARSGCKSEGYVMGDGSGVHPIAAYPGMEINELTHPAGDWTSERWIVERFR